MIKLNSFQKTFYFEWLQDNSKADYNLVIDMDLHGEISPERLNRAITRFVNEHLLYNSNVRYINGDYYWISRSCLNEKENILKYIDFLPSKKELFSFVKEPFDLESDRLSRYYLVRISESHYRFINVVSHIIVDGLSAESVYKNLACYYNDAEFRSEYSLEEQAEMIIKLNAKLSLIQENYKASMNNFWQRQLCNSTGIDLKFLKNQSQQSKLEIHSRKLNPISEFYFSIVDEEWNLVKEISRKYKITPFILSQVAFAFVIQKYTGQDCISFNFPVAIQEGRDLIYGAHVNSIIITFYFSDQTTLLDLIEQATSFYKDLKSSKGKYLPIYELVKYAENKSALNAGFIQTDLAEYILDFDGVKSVSANREFHIDLDQDFVFESQIVKSSLNQNEQLKFRVRYKNGIINHELAELFVKSYKEALLVISKQLMVSPSQTINDINKESVLDYNKTILSVINEQSKSVYDATKTVIMRFEEQVKRRPNDIAIVFDNKEISYTQLNIEANKLANYLKRAYNIKPDDFVCLCLERSEWMVIAMLGVLKCGAAYVPISPDYPLERVQYIINDVSPIVTIISQASASKLSLNNDVLSILIEQDYLWKNESDNNLELNIDSKNLAYVIYTSGTTGKAKGVMIEHRGLVNLCLSLNEKLRIYFHKKNINYLWYSNYVFDAHVMDLYPYLIHGHRVFIANEDVRLDVEGLKEYISSNKIDLSLIPPSFLNKNQIFNIKNLIVGGDITNGEIITQYLKAGTNIINAYGPTEVTVCATTHPYSIGDKNTNIGRPIANTSAYVLDKYLNPLPVGAIGELYIGGDGVARGYLNQPELTAERFLANPFQTEDEKKQGVNGRIYKTGDLVRYLPDGNIEYIGRNDFQVKIRGFRIELGEIESRIMGYPGIDNVAVMARDTAKGTKYLAAYYVSSAPVDERELAAYIGEQLPEYMIPSFFVQMEQLPVTINGKLDRKALPEPDVTSAENYVAPENDTERAICEIFGTVLGLEVANIGADDDFFKMGGDSISSIQLVNRIRQTFSVQISVKDIFAAKTVRRLSELVERQKGNRSSVISEQGLLGGEVMLSPIQEWFFDIKAKGMIPAYNHWNQSFLINVPLLDMDRLKLSIDKLLEYHDALRMSYTIGTEGYGQAYDTSVSEYTIRRLDVSQYADERQVAEILTAWQSELDIFNGKVFTVGYLSGYTDGNAKLFFAFHHLVIDTVSWRIIKDDLEKIYFYYADNPQDDTASAEKILGGKATSYRQWTERIIKNYPETYSDEKEYWDKMTSGIADTNKILEGIKRDEYVFTTISFDEEKTEKLLRDINGVYNTGMNDLLLTALAASLPVVTGNKQNHILLEGHGREELWENVDISNTAGWFTSMYPVRIDASDGELASRIISMKELLRGIPRNGIGYGALMGYISRELPRISFNYLGQFNSSEQGLWSITTNEYVNDVSPLNRDTNIININGGIFDNRLSFSFAGYISQAMIDMLTISFQNALTEIIEYLCSCTRSYLTPSDVRGIISAEYLNRLQSEKEVDDIYLANSLQQGFIYHAINQGDVDDAYRVQLSWDYHNVLNVELLKKSWELTQQKYETMRLRFAWEEELVQVIDKVGNLDWNYMEVEGLGQDARDKYLAELTAKDRERSFDLKEGSLFRIYLIRFEHDHYGFLFSNHHAILDGWSMPVLLNNVHETYIRLLKGEVLKSCSDLSYGNSQQYLQEHRFANVDYWKEQVRMVENHEDLDSLLKPELRSQVILSDYKHIREPQEESIVIEGEELKKMKSVCSHYGFTVNALLQYCWHKQLSIYGATETTVVGTVVSGRNIPIDGIEQSVGLYINTLPVILEHKDRPVVELIKSVQDKINEVNSRSDVGLASLQKEGKRLFNTLFVYENYPVPENREIDETLKYEFKESIEKLDYPLSINVIDNNKCVVLTLEYANEIFDKKIILQLISGIKLLWEKVLGSTSIQASEIKLLNNTEYELIIDKWNNTRAIYPSHKTIIELFEYQTAKTPDNIAVSYNGHKLTYQQLNNESNKIGNFIKEKYKIVADDLIAICLNRSENMIIAILGALKAGGAYVPISPDYPDERIKYKIYNRRYTNESNYNK